jgi:hypothetical protein
VTRTLLVVCEARADFQIAADLADRLISNSLATPDAPALPAVRRWHESEPDRPFIRWTDLDKVAATRGLRLRPRSRFGGQPGAADAAAADKALLLAAFIARKDGLVGVLLIRDSDGYEERHTGLMQARTTESGAPWPFRVAIGLAHPKREAWVLAGFEPQDAAEQGRLGDLRRELGRDPCQESHEFAARTKGSKRDLKRILDHLTAGNTAREAPCWQASPLDLLRKRGQSNGLAAYLAEIDEHIVPLLSPE